MNTPIKSKSIYDHIDEQEGALDLQVISIKLPKNLVSELELVAQYQELNLEAAIYLVLDEYAQRATKDFGITLNKDVNA